MALIEADREADHDDMINVFEELSADNVMQSSSAPMTPQNRQ